MRFRLVFTSEARRQLQDLERSEDGQDLDKLKRVRKCLGLLETNPRHAGLNSHKYLGHVTAEGVELWESYVENRTPSAWRVFWHYGPGQGAITVVAITPHP